MAEIVSVQIIIIIIIIILHYYYYFGLRTGIVFLHNIVMTKRNKKIKIKSGSGIIGGIITKLYASKIM